MASRAEDEYSALRESVDDLIERIRAYAEKYGTHHETHPMYPATFYDLVDAEKSGKVRRQLHVPVPNAHAPEREFDDIARLFGASLLPRPEGDPKKMTVEEYDAFEARVLRYAVNRLPAITERDIMTRHGFFPDYDIVYAIKSELPRKYVTGLYKGETEAEPGKIPEIPDDDAHVFKGSPDAVDFTNFPTAGVRVGDDLVKRFDAMDAADRVPETQPRAPSPLPPETIADRTFFMERTRMGYVPGPAPPPVRVTDDIKKEFVRLDVANLVPDAPVPTDAPDSTEVPDHAPTTAYERIVSENTVLTDAAIDAIKRALDAVRNAPPTVPVVPAPTTESHVSVNDHAKEFDRFVRERDAPVVPPNATPVDTTPKIVAAAVAARVHADPRLTGFRVGAAVMTSTGKIFTGSNAEIPSGQILHAETFALGAARSAGHRDIVAMCVASECETCTPCGQCREWIRSAMPPDAPVYVHNNLDGRTTTMFVKDLLADPPVLNLTPKPDQTHDLY